MLSVQKILKVRKNKTQKLLAANAELKTNGGRISASRLSLNSRIGIWSVFLGQLVHKTQRGRAAGKQKEVKKEDPPKLLAPNDEPKTEDRTEDW